MGNIKDIFKILLVIQLLVGALASSGHPDAETIDFGSPGQPSREQAIIEAAIKRGMDGAAVSELLYTKKPVTKTITMPGGVTKTTTYKLEPDGSISSKTITSKRSSYVYNGSNIPDSIPIDDLQKSPSGTITRSFFDENGNKVTQTIAVSQPKPSTVLDTNNLSGDLFGKTFSSWPDERPAVPSSSSGHRTITRTFTGPNGERRTVQSWSSDPNFMEPEVPAISPHTYNHRTFTRTYIGPNGEKHVTTHTSPNNPDPFNVPKNTGFPSLDDTNWPSFDDSSFPQSWDTPDTEDSDDWKVVDDNPDVETTTKKAIESWTPKTWNWPQFPTFTTSTTTSTVRPKILIEPEVTTRKPLPNLQDFLKSQYGPAANFEKTTTPPRTTTNIPRSLTAHNPTTKKPTVINIEDLPVTEILHNGKPLDEAILKKLPSHLTPKFPTENILKIENKHPIEEDLEIFTPKMEKNIRTFSKTHVGSKKPTLKDLDPQMQEVLKKAGINPEDITDINGDTITKTRQEPDGRIITTTYKVNTVPRSTPVEQPIQLHIPTQVYSHSTFNSYNPSILPQASLLPKPTPIEEFLAKLGLTKFDISSRNGQLTKTFIDENGEVLTASFVLSSPKGRTTNEKPREKPLK